MRISKDLVPASATPIVLGVLASGEDYGYYTHNYSYYHESGKKSRRPGSKPGKESAPADRLEFREPDPRDRKG